jgi:hypothetical protein
VFGRLGVALGEGGHDAVELGCHGVGVGLVEDGADLVATCGCADLGTLVSRLGR